jgi:hypothetical protein
MGKVGLLAYTLFSRALAVLTAVTAVVFLANKDRMGDGIPAPPSTFLAVLLLFR